MEKYVLLTGANGGIGRHVLVSLLNVGYKVISLDISDSNIKEMSTTFVKCDITKHEELGKAFNKIKETTS